MYGIITTSGAADAKFFSLVATNPEKEIDPAAKFSPEDLNVITTPLQDGDLMRVFNSIAEGKKLLECTIDFERDEQYQQFQKGVDRDLWASLFHLSLPAKLQKQDGSTIDGNLMPFCETGMEGRVDWVLFDFHKNSYKSTHWLKDGDLLTVFSHVTNGDIEWQGRVAFDDAEHITGKNVMVVNYEESPGKPDEPYGSFSIDKVQEKYTKTLITPDLKTMEEFSLYNRPALVMRGDI